MGLFALVLGLVCCVPRKKTELCCLHCSLTVLDKGISQCKAQYLTGIFLQGTLLNKEVSALTLSCSTYEN